MKPKRIKKRKRQFAVMVDADLLDRANAARVETWVDLVERMLCSILAEEIKVQQAIDLANGKR